MYHIIPKMYNFARRKIYLEVLRSHIYNQDNINETKTLKYY